MILQIALACLLAVAVGYFGGFYLGASFALGATVMWVNAGLIGWTWKRLMDKKSIALTTTVIVIKYAVLLGSVFNLTRTDWFSVLGAGLGIASFALAVLATALLFRNQE